MKIAFIGQKGIPAVYGGVERYVESMAVRMASQGHDVSVYVRDHYTDKKLGEYKGVKLIHLPTINAKNLDAITHTFLSTMHALFQQYDIIHYQAIGPASLSFIPKFFRPQFVVAATFHCQDYFHQKWGFLARMYLKFGELVTCRVPHRTITVSKTLKNYVRKAYGKDCIHIPNGAEIKETDRFNAITKWDLKSKRYVVAITRLIRHKGIHFLIEAFKRSKDEKKIPPDFKLVIVGDGYHTEGYVGYLKKISTGREDIVFTGSQNGEVLAQLFSNAYLFVQPSESEGLSIAILEAMSHGTATLVSDIPENIEAVGDVGFSFRSKDVAALKIQLDRLINDPRLVQEAAEKGRVRARSEYDWDKIVNRTLEVYADALNEKKLSNR